MALKNPLTPGLRCGRVQAPAQEPSELARLRRGLKQACLGRLAVGSWAAAGQPGARMGRASTGSDPLLPLCPTPSSPTPRNHKPQLAWTHLPRGQLALTCLSLPSLFQCGDRCLLPKSSSKTPSAGLCPPRGAKTPQRARGAPHFTITCTESILKCSLLRP